MKTYALSLLVVLATMALLLAVTAVYAQEGEQTFLPIVRTESGTAASVQADEDQLVSAADVSSPGCENGICYVDDTAVGDNNCRSWADACIDLQVALAVAESGEEIWVAEGIYRPDNSTPPNREASFVLKQGVGVYGGFDGSETQLEQRDWLANVTTLSGNGSYHVLYGGPDTDETTVVDGFVVTGGSALGSSSASFGGGMLIEDGSPSVKHVIFEDNLARSGGGVYVEYGSPSLFDVILPVQRRLWIRWRHVQSGGCPNLDRVSFEENTAWYVGGGMNNASGCLTVTNSSFVGNRSTHVGGGLANSHSDPVLTNVVFSGNWSELGGGLASTYGNPKLTNTSFYDNHAWFDEEGAAIREYGGHIVVQNSIIWVNTPIQITGNVTIVYSDVEGPDSWVHPGEGNINADPLFVDPAAVDLHLELGSPAIDVGNNSLVPAGVSTDLGGNPRIVGGTVDMGAYEYVPLTPQQQAEILIDEVQELAEDGLLNQGEANALTVKLDHVVKHLAEDKTKTACNVLGAFVNQVQSLVDEGTLLPDEAQPLLEGAASIATDLGCS